MNTVMSTTAQDEMHTVGDPLSRLSHRLEQGDAYVVWRPLHTRDLSLQEILNRAASHGYRYHSGGAFASGTVRADEYTLLIFERKGRIARWLDR
jgi:hypothetical protein